LQLLQAGRTEEALPLAERAVSGASTCLPAHGLLALTLSRLKRLRDADAVIVAAMALSEGIADAYDALAYASMAVGNHERASELYRRAADLSPDVSRYWYNLAACERGLGRLAAAESACDRSISADASAYPSYLLRSELRVQTAELNHVGELKSRLVRAAGDVRARIFLGYALGKELDDQGQFDEAFRWFSAAAQARRSRLSYDVGLDEQKMKCIVEAFASSPVDAVSEAVDSSRYVFIVGLPRSGTTLVERILTGLSGVHSNGETDNFPRALFAVAGTETHGIFSRAAAADPRQVARKYAEFADRADAQEVIVEKLPMNYLYVGAICRALPESKILWIRRSPLDSCFAMYRTLFGHAYPFSYDFGDLARYYASYTRLMRHWSGLLGNRLRTVGYERLIADPRGEGAAFADYCGLAWRDSALEIQNNTSVSLTASAAQIRRPIYGSSSGRWRHYREHLRPLIQLLGKSGVELPEDAQWAL
jgi:tetratricopeptide (TPR) repeat protein